MPRELGLDHLGEGFVVPLLVGVGDGADLAVRVVSQGGAHGGLILADAAGGGVVQVGDGAVELVRDDRGGLLGAAAGEDHAEEVGGLGREVAADVAVEILAEEAVVLALDGVHVGVGAAEQDVVEDGLVGADALDGVVEDVAVLGEGAADQGLERLAEVARRFRVDVLEQVAHEALVVGL